MTQAVPSLDAQPAQVAGDRAVVNRTLRYGRVADLRLRARRRVPGFAFDFVDLGAGGRTALQRHRDALDRVEIVSRYGYGAPVASTEVTLFGRSYRAPIIV